MELTLNRINYIQVKTTNKGCMQLRSGESKHKWKKLDKIVVGDQTGVVQCLARKELETLVVFNVDFGAPVNCMRFGGALGTVQDKVFVAGGGKVKGYSKKGKNFFTLEAGKTEVISSMFVYGVDLFVCGDSLLIHYRDGVEVFIYRCEDIINDIICLPVTEGSWVGRGVTPALACGDCTIKVLDGDKFDYEIDVSSVPNVLQLFLNDGGLTKQKVLYGTIDGYLGLIDLPPNAGKILWKIKTKSAGKINAICCYPLSGHTVPDIIIGKEDGLVEVYSIDSSENATLRKIFQCEEGIVSVQAGRVSSKNYDEIVLCTYGGCIFALTTELKTSTNISLKPQIKIKVQELKTEIEHIENRVARERQRYDDLAAKNGNVRAILPKLDIQDYFTLNMENCCYAFDSNVDIVDTGQTSAVVSVLSPNDTKVQPENGFLATFRCPTDTTKVVIRIRAIEGQHVLINAYICTKYQPKVCQVTTYHMRPLSLHERTHNFDASRPENILKFEGDFSISDAYQWVNLLFPEVPERINYGESVTHNFISKLIGTQVQAQYGKGEAIFKSDNVSTIAIIKDIVCQDAMRQHIQLDIHCEIDEKSIAHTLKLLNPLMEYQTKLKRDYELSQAIQELSDNSEDLWYLTKDMSELLASNNKLHDEIIKLNSFDKQIENVITTLYIDKERLQGRNGKHKLSELRSVLVNYDLQALNKFFS